MYVASFYQFFEVDEIASVLLTLQRQCEEISVSGSFILASEGINVVLAHTDKEVLETLINQLLDSLELSDLRPTLSRAQHNTRPFDKLLFRVRPEIVSFGALFDFKLPPLPKLTPFEWRERMLAGDILLLDVRNEYEHRLGRFRNSIQPKTKNFREFKNFLDQQTEFDKTDPVAIYCTGGIRCEKAAQYMHKLGFESVKQLDRGILGYFDSIAEEPLWEGECFVFDQRVAVNQTLFEGIAKLCVSCGSPLAAKDKSSPLFKYGISCATCWHSTTPEKRERIKYRLRLIEARTQVQIRTKWAHDSESEVSPSQ